MVSFGTAFIFMKYLNMMVKTACEMFSRLDDFHAKPPHYTFRPELNKKTVYFNGGVQEKLYKNKPQATASLGFSLSVKGLFIPK